MVRSDCLFLYRAMSGAMKHMELNETASISKIKLEEKYLSSFIDIFCDKELLYCHNTVHIQENICGLW